VLAEAAAETEAAGENAGFEMVAYAELAEFWCCDSGNQVWKEGRACTILSTEELASELELADELELAAWSLY
jgi:hypothetical protein